MKLISCRCDAPVGLAGMFDFFDLRLNRAGDLVLRLDVECAERFPMDIFQAGGQRGVGSGVRCSRQSKLASLQVSPHSDVFLSTSFSGLRGIRQFRSSALRVFPSLVDSAMGLLQGVRILTLRSLLEGG